MCGPKAPARDIPQVDIHRAEVESSRRIQTASPVVVEGGDVAGASRRILVGRAQTMALQEQVGARAHGLADVAVELGVGRRRAALRITPVK